MATPLPPFAGETVETILARMLAAVDDSFVKTEGDFIYDTLAPAALAIEHLYQYLETYLWQVFPQLASNANLDALAFQLANGLTRTAGESDTAFRARLLGRLSTPRGAGSYADYISAVATVPGTGVASLYVDDLSSFDIYIYFLDDTRNEPSLGLVSDTQAALDAMAPLGASVIVSGATIDPDADGPVVITLAPASQASAAQRVAWRNAVADWFTTAPPGTTLSKLPILNFAGIPPSEVQSFTFAMTPWDIGYDTDKAFRATSVTVV